jgi:hypothetical protein
VEVLIENGQATLASSGDKIPPCGVPVRVSRFGPSSVRTPALRNALTSPRDLLVRDPPPHPVQQGLMVDLVEARGEVGLEHTPVIPDG